MKRYDEYKETNQVWLTFIPKHWDTIKIKNQFVEISDKNHADEIPLVASQHMGVVPKSIYGLRTVEATKGLELFKRVMAGDFVISLRSFQGGLEFAYYQGVISPAYTILRCKNNGFNQYYRYLFKSAVFIKLLTLCVTGIREGQNIDYATLKQFSIPVPPSSEQDQIVRYLDWQTSRINKLINGYKRQIELLEERKQTIIDQYSTQGIDKTVRFKKSGTHWLSEIPEHWNMVYSKQLFAQRKDKAFSDDIQLTASQKYGILSQDEFMKLEGRRVTVVMTGNDILKHVGKGDFVISMRSFQGGLEYSRTEGKISSAYVMLIPNREKVCDDYFRWLLKSTPYIKALQGTADLVRDGQALRYANFAKVSLPEIPLNEQKEIAERIQTETEKIDNAIPIFGKQIALLQEYRTRLISDVVTGQIDVRDIDIPEYVSEEEYNDDLQDNTNDMEGDINE